MNAIPQWISAPTVFLLKRNKKLVKEKPTNSGKFAGFFLCVFAQKTEHNFVYIFIIKA